MDKREIKNKEIICCCTKFKSVSTLSSYVDAKTIYCIRYTKFKVSKKISRKHQKNGNVKMEFTGCLPIRFVSYDDAELFLKNSGYKLSDSHGEWYEIESAKLVTKVYKPVN